MQVFSILHSLCSRRHSVQPLSENVLSQIPWNVIQVWHPVQSIRLAQVKGVPRVKQPKSTIPPASQRKPDHGQTHRRLHGISCIWHTTAPAIHNGFFLPLANPVQHVRTCRRAPMKMHQHWNAINAQAHLQERNPPPTRIVPKHATGCAQVQTVAFPNQ